MVANFNSWCLPDLPYCFKVTFLPKVLGILTPWGEKTYERWDWAIKVIIHSLIFYNSDDIWIFFLCHCFGFLTSQEFGWQLFSSQFSYVALLSAVLRSSLVNPISTANSVAKETGDVTNFYRSQPSCGKVMFLHLSVILFTMGMCLADTPLGRHPPGRPPRADTPQQTPDTPLDRHQIPPQADTRHTPLSRHPPEKTPPRADTPRQTPPADTRHPLGRHQTPPGQTPDTPPWADTPWANSTRPPGTVPLQQTVHILLECILVYWVFTFKSAFSLSLAKAFNLNEFK